MQSDLANRTRSFVPQDDKKKLTANANFYIRHPMFGVLYYFFFRQSESFGRKRVKHAGRCGGRALEPLQCIGQSATRPE